MSAPTERDIEVLLALIKHGSGKDAARALFITPGTVKNHMDHLYRVIGAKGRAHAAVLLWPLLHGRYRLPGDERRVAQRRAA